MGFGSVRGLKRIVLMLGIRCVLSDGRWTVDKMAQWVKVLVAKPVTSEFNSSRSTWWKERSKSLQAGL